jgi:hypothetical protein
MRVRNARNRCILTKRAPEPNSSAERSGRNDHVYLLTVPEFIGPAEPEEPAGAPGAAPDEVPGGVGPEEPGVPCCAIAI